MAFIRNKTGKVGDTVVIDRDVIVLTGTLKAGSRCTVISPPNYFGEFTVRDNESGEEVGIHPAFCDYHYEE